MIIDQLPAAASVDLTDELPIEKGQLTYKATVSQIADKATANLAYEYHNYTAYSVGDYVIHEGVLYKCTTDILVGEDFDPSKWAQVALANEVEDVKNNLGSAVEAVKSDIGYVENGDTATHTIEAWQYVIWKGDLYCSIQAIPIGDTLSLSNLQAVSNGAVNDLRRSVTEIVTDGWSALIIGTGNVKANSGAIILNPTLKLVEFDMFDMLTGATLTPGNVYSVGGAKKPFFIVRTDVNRVDGAAAVGTIEIDTNGVVVLKPLETIPSGVTLRAHITYFYVD